MVQYDSSTLDTALAALADPTRRGVLERLSEREATISVLAERFDMTLTGMKKHIAVLEHAGLVSTRKVGRVRQCSLGPHHLGDLSAWIENYRAKWEARFDALDVVLAGSPKEENENGQG
ncbi:MAG: metalloregulator ArsR/SmtB family transcription factor [Porphyrobacter sp.]|nr:metalloregulator ArsR/SmtB family transcription factor [Porphyrobacter sp.]